MKDVYIKILLLLPVPVSRFVISIFRFIKYFNVKPEEIGYSEGFKKINIDGIEFDILLSHKNGLVDDFIYTNGTWDEHILRLLKEHLTSESVFVDVGANIGFFSLYASRLCEKVVSFEPIDFLHKQFSLSIERNNIENIEIRNKACGAQNAIAKINLVRGNIGASSIKLHNDSYESIDINVSTLDFEFIKEKVDLIKIDTEGFEVEVFKGAQEIIKRDMPIIIFEFSPVLYEGQVPGSSLSLLQMITDLGYNILDARSRCLIDNKESFIKELLIKSAQADLLCVPHG